MVIYMRIDGGYTVRARQTIDSDIFLFKPAIYFKIWFLLVNRANYKDNSKRERWSFHITYKEIASRTWANKDQINKCIRWLKVSHMIATTKATRWMHVTIVKYKDYQDQDNYKSHTEAHTKATTEPQKSHTKSKERKKEEENTFELFWKKFPHARKGKKKDAMKLYVENEHPPETIDNEVKLLLRKIQVGQQDPNFIPACERRVRDFVPTNETVYEKIIYSIRKEIHTTKKFDDPIYMKFKEDYPNELIMSMYEHRRKEKSNALTSSLQWKKV